MIKDIFNISQIKEHKEKLEKDCADWNSKYTTLEAAYNELKTASESFLVEKDTFNKQIEALNEAHSKEVEQLKADLVAKNAEVEQKAAQIVAGIGFAQEALPAITTTETSPKATYDKWQAMLSAGDQKVAADFYKANREALINFVGFKAK